MADIGQITKKLADNDQRYAAHFAGQSRATRNLDLLDDLIATAQQLLTQAGQATGSAADKREAIQAAERQVELYRSERTLIVQSRQQGGPQSVEAGRIGMRANFVFHRYDRHFAGSSRSSRDNTLMADMIDELKGLRAAMAAMVAVRPDLSSARGDMDVIDGRLQQFEEERRQIAAAQTDGTHAEQAAALAGIANNAFAQYRAVFADQPRVTRRPELLVRLIGALQQVRERMQALQAQGLALASNDQNIAIVTERLTAWQSELAAIRADRQKATIVSLESDLGTAANAEFEMWGAHFAGQARKTRDLARLRAMIDRLDEVERQMTRLDQVHGRPENARNLQIVRDNLAMYCGEYDEIVKAQAV